MPPHHAYIEPDLLAQFPGYIYPYNGYAPSQLPPLWQGPFANIPPQAASTPRRPHAANPAPERLHQPPPFDARPPRQRSQSSRFPVRGILSKPDASSVPITATSIGESVTLENRVRWSSPQEFLFSPTASYSSASIPFLVPYPSTPVIWAPDPPISISQPLPTPLELYQAPRLQYNDQAPLSSSPLSHEISFANPIQTALQPVEDPAPRRRLKRSLSNGDKPYSLGSTRQTVQEIPHRPVPMPLAEAHEAIVAEAKVCSSKKAKAAAENTKKKAKAVVRALEDAVEIDGYESDELNLRPEASVIASEVC